MIRTVWLFVSLALLSLPAQAHGGGLNSEGCHNDRKRGTYHCHRGSYTPPTTGSPAYSGRSAASGSAITTLTDPRAETSHPASRDLIFAAQKLLVFHDCLAGEADGLPGPQTMTAVSAFQRAADLPQNPVIDDRLVADLARALETGAACDAQMDNEGQDQGPVNLQ